MRRRLDERSLRWRLTATTTLAAMVLSGLVAVVVYTVMVRQLRSVVDDGLDDRLDELVANIGNGDLDVSDDDQLAQVIDYRGGDWLSRAVPEGANSLLPWEYQNQMTSHRYHGTFDVKGIDGPVRLAAVLARTPNDDDVVDDYALAIVGRNLSPVEAASGRLLWQIALAALGLAAVAAALGAWLIRRVLRPVAALAAQTKHVDLDGGSVQIAVPAGRDEFTQLAESFNALLGRLTRARQREQEFIGNVSHELRTPLTVVRGELELARSQVDGEVRDGLGYGIEEADRMNDTIDRLLLLARAEAGRVPSKPIPVDVSTLVRDVAGSFTATAAEVKVDVTIEADCDAPVVIEADIVHQNLTNLVANAVRHANGRVVVTGACDGDGMVRFMVADDGEGFPDGFTVESVRRFGTGEPTDRAVGHQRTGLGLAIVAALCDSARIDLVLCRSSQLGGAEVSMSMQQVTPPIARSHDPLIGELAESDMSQRHGAVGPE